VNPNDASYTSRTDSNSNSNSNKRNDDLNEPNNNDDNITDILGVGPPDPIRFLQLNQQIEAYRNNQQNVPTNFTIERVSNTPDIFILRDFLSIEECDCIIYEASSNTNMTQAETVTENDHKSRKHCQVAWIPSSSAGGAGTANSNHDNVINPSTISLVSNLVSSTANIFLSSQIKQNPTTFVEDLQVLRYGLNGEFVLHHDGEPRVLTVIYYINGVANTWFPLASTATARNSSTSSFDDNIINSKEIERGFEYIRNNHKYNLTPQNKGQALKLGEGFKPGTHGVLVKGIGVGDNDVKECNDDSVNNGDNDNNHIAYVKKGDAVAFYNYCIDGSEYKLDWRALHTGLPTTEVDGGVKWIANHWFRLDDLL